MFEKALRTMFERSWKDQQAFSYVCQHLTLILFCVEVRERISTLIFISATKCLPSIHMIDVCTGDTNIILYCWIQLYCYYSFMSDPVSWIYIMQNPKVPSWMNLGSSTNLTLFPVRTQVIAWAGRGCRSPSKSPQKRPAPKRGPSPRMERHGDMLARSWCPAFSYQCLSQHMSAPVNASGHELVLNNTGPCSINFWSMCGFALWPQCIGALHYWEHRWVVARPCTWQDSLNQTLQL